MDGWKNGWTGPILQDLSGRGLGSNKRGLYHDDGFTIFRNISGQQAEKHLKIIQTIFKDRCLQIIIKYNLKIVDYLDVTLNLNDGTCHLFHKPNEETTHIHVECNHHLQLSRKVQDLLKKDQPPHLQQRKYLKIRKISMSSVYNNGDITKN